MARTQFKTVALTEEARDELRQFVAIVGGHLERSVSMSEALVRAIRIAKVHVKASAAENEPRQ